MPLPFQQHKVNNRLSVYQPWGPHNLTTETLELRQAHMQASKRVQAAAQPLQLTPSNNLHHLHHMPLKVCAARNSSSNLISAPATSPKWLNNGDSTLSNNDSALSPKN